MKSLLIFINMCAFIVVANAHGQLMDPPNRILANNIPFPMSEQKSFYQGVNFIRYFLLGKKILNYLY